MTLIESPAPCQGQDDNTHPMFPGNVVLHFNLYVHKHLGQRTLDPFFILSSLISQCETTPLTKEKSICFIFSTLEQINLDHLVKP